MHLARTFAAALCLACTLAAAVAQDVPPTPSPAAAPAEPSPAAAAPAEPSPSAAAPAEPTPAATAQDAAQPWLPTPFVPPTPSPSPGAPLCKKPDLSGLGPVTPDVTTDVNAYSEDHNSLIRSRNALRERLAHFEAWYNNVRSCYHNPDDPVWYLVDWSCLINNLLQPVEPRRFMAPSTGGYSYKILENGQYFYQCGKTCRWWVNNHYRF